MKLSFKKKPYKAGSEETPLPERGSGEIPATESVGDRFNRFRSCPPIKMKHDLKFMAGRMDDPAVARHLDDKQKESFASGRQLLATRSGQKVYYVKDPIDILQSAYSLAQFDLPLYLRFEAHADSLDHFVIGRISSLLLGYECARLSLLVKE